MIGQTISHYRVTAELGAGGMGVVYRAEDLRLGRPVAIKFLPDSAAADPQALERFHREARAASALNHRHICTIHEIDEHAGRPFIVMEILEGETLQNRIARKRFDLEGLLDVTMQVAEGLEAAHAKGIVHRDIKPSNIFVTSAGEVKILDFGLAKLAADGAGGVNAESSPGVTITSPGVLMTGPGTTMGTVAYMSPEQVRGEELDGRTDIFSCGVVLYEMATAALPFPGATTGIIFDGILNKTPATASTLNPVIPGELNRIVDKALEKDRDLRYQSARDLRADLARLRRDSGSARSQTAASAPAPAASRSRRRAIVAAASRSRSGGAGHRRVPRLAEARTRHIDRTTVAEPRDVRGRPAGTTHMVSRRPLHRLHLGPGRQLRHLGAADRRRPRCASHDRSRHRLAAVVVGRRKHARVSIGARWRRHFRRTGARWSRTPADDVRILAGVVSQEIRTTFRGPAAAAECLGRLPPVYLAGLDGAPPKQILADVIGKFRSVGRISVASGRAANLVPGHDGNRGWILDSADFRRRARSLERRRHGVAHA